MNSLRALPLPIGIATLAACGAPTRAPFDAEPEGTGDGSDIKEPADTNLDGKVSAKEQAAYDAKLVAERAAAVKAYESVGQLGQDAAAA